MADQPIVVNVPEELIRRAAAVGVDVQHVMIEALENEVSRQQTGGSLATLVDQLNAMPDDLKPTEAELQEAVREAREQVYEERR